mmetsp:Transcript_79122/g.212316  ORF Transcript_79122/g.212316 Transcript_79122/m.212316 type:complete len:127 (+) Transcript_79122:40-420(+)
MDASIQQQITLTISLTQQCLRICAQLQEDSKISVPGLYKAPSSNSKDVREDTTVGLMLQGTVVSGTLLGSPAWAAEFFAEGDIIILVDNMAVNEENVEQLIRGNDVPDTMVAITVRKGGMTVALDL